ncbi:hypothetical protein TMEN_3206 [Trichophyton mentagrophytes]|nr:hypothetical protein TMEN_3206 [Trichophyton mentagrophytes]
MESQGNHTAESEAVIVKEDVASLTGIIRLSNAGLFGGLPPGSVNT